jgi:hypothetical protein
MPRIGAHVDSAASYQQRYRRTNGKWLRNVTYSPGLIACKKLKPTDPYSNENLLATLEKLKAESAEQSTQAQQRKCVELTAPLVDYFAEQVISPNLSRRFGNWHHDVRRQLQLDNVNRHRSELVQQVEEIAISKRLTKKQWQCLVYLALSMGESECMNIVTREYLNEVRELSRVIELHDHQTVCALIDAIEEHLKMK